MSNSLRLPAKYSSSCCFVCSRTGEDAVLNFAFTYRSILRKFRSAQGIPFQSHKHRALSSDAKMSFPHGVG